MCKEKHFNSMDCGADFDSNLHFDEFDDVLEQLFFEKVCQLNSFQYLSQIHSSLHN